MRREVPGSHLESRRDELSGGVFPQLQVLSGCSLRQANGFSDHRVLRLRDVQTSVLFLSFQDLKAAFPDFIIGTMKFRRGKGHFSFLHA